MVPMALFMAARFPSCSTTFSGASSPRPECERELPGSGFDYRRVTPVNQQLQLSGWISRIDGRKYSVQGELRINDIVTAEATSLFVELRPGAI